MTKPTRSGWVLVAVAALAVAGGLGYATLSPDSAYTVIECDFAQPAGLEVECGELIVPMDRRTSASRTITLAVAILHSTGRDHAEDPVLFLQGGPGGESLSIAANFAYGASRAVPFVTDRDVILVDVRGTGRSSPSLDCPEVAAHELEALALAIDEAPDAHAAAVRACRDRLAADGVDLDAFNSAAVAADVADLRTALGIDEWNVYGPSYGARFALTLARDHPEGLRTLILDSPYAPSNDPTAEWPRSLNVALDALFAHCAAEPSCVDAHPDFEGHLIGLVEDLNESPVTVTATAPSTGTRYSVRIDGVRALQYVYYKLHYDGPRLWRDLDGLENGDVQPVADELLLWTDALHSLSEGLYLSATCHEETPFETADDIRDAVEDGRAWAPGDLVHLLLREHEDCAIWDIAAADELEDEVVATDVPTLILSGGFDPITPPSFGAEIAEHASNSAPVLFPALGHVVAGDPCADSVIRAFLDDPSMAPDAECATP